MCSEMGYGVDAQEKKSLLKLYCSTVSLGFVIIHIVSSYGTINANMHHPKSPTFVISYVIKNII